MIKFLQGLLLIIANDKGNFGEPAEQAPEPTESVETTPETEVSEDAEGGDQPETESPDYEKALEGIETNEEDLLASLNGLGVVRNGDMVKFDSVEAVRELISKGNDYTAKTQEHSETVKAFEAEMQTQREAFEQEKAEYEANAPQMSELQFENDFFTNWVTQLQQTDPDLFQEFSHSFQSALNQHSQIQNNPALQAYKAELDGLKNELGQFKQSKFQDENKEILSSFDSGYEKELTSMAPRLASAGIFVNKGKVQEMWSKNDDMSPKQAIFAVYGEQLLKTESSAAKLVKTKLQSERRTGGQSPEDTSMRKDLPEGKNRIDAIREKYASKFG